MPHRANHRATAMEATRGEGAMGSHEVAARRHAVVVGLACHFRVAVGSGRNLLWRAACECNKTENGEGERMLHAREDTGIEMRTCMHELMCGSSDIALQKAKHDVD